MPLSKFIKQKLQQYRVATANLDDLRITTAVLKMYLDDIQKLLRVNMTEITDKEMKPIIQDLGKFYGEVDSLKKKYEQKDLIGKTGPLKSIDGLLTNLNSAQKNLAKASEWYGPKEKGKEKLRNKPLDYYYDYMDKCIESLAAALSQIKTR